MWVFKFYFDWNINIKLCRIPEFCAGRKLKKFWSVRIETCPPKNILKISLLWTPKICQVETTSVKSRGVDERIMSSGVVERQIKSTRRVSNLVKMTSVKSSQDIECQVENGKYWGFPSLQFPKSEPLLFRIITGSSSCLFSRTFEELSFKILEKEENV